MRILFVALILTAGPRALADRGPCLVNLRPMLQRFDPLAEYAATGTFSKALVERIRAVRAIEGTGAGHASTHRRDELERAAIVLDDVDRWLNEVPGGDDAPFNSVGSGRADYRIYRGLRGNHEIITLRRFRDKFLWEIEAVEDENGHRHLVTTGLNGDLGDVREALRMTAHRFPRRRPR